MSAHLLSIIFVASFLYRLPNLCSNETILIVQAVPANDEFDDEADPDEDQDFIGFA
jgi:hypothetical protein